ncbi:helix-turn-helix domain-containing protein [Paenibacillus yanchengensis]|uniref:Helix-turn-helix domain-containing protein n=1 Tax=Paenibacillus yanchengensis TaxID=2035833 RepID=A0ABW4YGK3_9BACL
MRSQFTKLFRNNKPYSWSYLNYSTKDFKGYYHWHRGCELLFVHQGKGTVVVDQQTYPLTAGMVFFFRPFQLHKIYAEVSELEPYERSTFHFDQEVFLTYMNHFSSFREMLLHMQYGISSKQAFPLKDQLHFITNACASFEYNRKQPTAAAENEQAVVFLLQILACLYEPTEKSEKRAPYSADTANYIEQAMLWIEQHYMEPFELDRLAQDIHISKSHLSRLFHKETGSSLTNYLTARRIQQACYLLQSTHLPTDQIGEMVGLFNVSYFIQAFKKTMGTTPHQYRLQLNGNDNS